MKTNKAHDARRYVFQAGEPVLIDANVWLYLASPASQPAPSWAAPYSDALKRLLQAGAVPILDALVLSEYFNRYVRIEFKAMKGKESVDFKEFRRSSQGMGFAKAAVAEVRDMLRIVRREDTRLSTLDLLEVLNEVESGTCDFNDAILIESCHRGSWKLMTHDGDMIRGGIEVITTHGRLLRACP